MDNQKKANWVKVGSIVTSKNNPDTLYVAVDSYKGDLLYVEKSTQKVFKVKSITIREPFEKDPEFVQKVLSLNLDNPKNAELIEDGTQNEPAAK